jgi:hypothetical protein
MPFHCAQRQTKHDSRGNTNTACQRHHKHRKLFAAALAMNSDLRGNIKSTIDDNPG